MDCHIGLTGVGGLDRQPHVLYAFPVKSFDEIDLSRVRVDSEVFVRDRDRICDDIVIAIRCRNLPQINVTDVELRMCVRATGIHTCVKAYRYVCI